MNQLLSAQIQAFVSLAEEIGQSVLSPLAEETDREARWPEKQMAELGKAGLLGLLVPRRYGGHEQGLLALAAVTETLARFCSSTAMCFGMHCVGTAVIAAKTNEDQGERYLRPIAAGKHITTLALSERETGSHFYLPQTSLTRDGSGYILSGSKHFVTNGSKADSYVVSTGPVGGDSEEGEFNCLILEGNTEGLHWLDPWDGIGMRGNSSRGLTLDAVRIPGRNRLGNEGDESWYVFEVVAPYFMLAMSGAYLGISQASLDYTVHYVNQREHRHTGQTLAEIPGIQTKIAQMWGEVSKGRSLTYLAAIEGDAGDASALLNIFASKAEIGDTVKRVTNEAMDICGGIAYRENSFLSRMLRDGRAAHVMSPTTDLLRLWLGRALLGQPLL